MSVGRATSIAGILLVLGSVGGAVSKWYLVWLAQRIGGPEALGAYGLLFAFATPIFVASQLGLRTVFLSKEIALPWRSYVLLRVFGLFAGSIILLGVIISSPSISLSLGFSVLCLKIFDSIVDLDLAKLQYNGNVIAMATLTLTGAPLAILFATLGAQVANSLSVAVGGAALASIIVAVLARIRSSKVRYVADSKESGLKEILSASAPVTVATLLASLLSYLPIFFLGFSAELAVVGLFTGISYVLTVADLLGSSLSKLLITPLRNLRKRSGTNAVVKKVNTLTIQLAAAGSVAGVVFIMVGSSLFQWIYGPDFKLSSPVLTLLAGGAVFVLVSHIQSIGLHVLNRYYRVATSYVFACFLALIVGLVLSLVGADTLVVGAGIAAAGAAGRALMMIFGVSKAHATG